MASITTDASAAPMQHADELLRQMTIGGEERAFLSVARIGS